MRDERRTGEARGVGGLDPGRAGPVAEPKGGTGRLRRREWREIREEGMVTVETAVGVLAVGFVLTLLAMLAHIAFLYVGAQEAARAAARMASLDEPTASIQRIVRQKVPGARIRVDRNDRTIEVTVSVPPEGLSGALGIGVEARTVAFAEPGARARAGGDG